MARIIIEEKDFEAARKELASIGIILYRREHRKGGYVCRAGRRLRESLREVYALRSLPSAGYKISGSL